MSQQGVEIVAELPLRRNKLEEAESVGLAISDIYILNLTIIRTITSPIKQSLSLIQKSIIKVWQVCGCGFYNLKMNPFQVKTYQKYQNQSLMALSSNNQGEATKKTIQSEDYFNFQPAVISTHRKYTFLLPFSTPVHAVLNALTSKFTDSLIHVESDSKTGEIILEGLRAKGLRRVCGKVMDFLFFCCSRGIKYGLLEETYNIILITIKREVIENRCIVTVSNPYKQQGLNSLFASQILDPIQDQLKTLGKQAEAVRQESHANEWLSQSSPCQLEMHVHKKIYELFVLPDVPDLSRYKNIFLYSLEKVKEEMTIHTQKLNLATSKKNLPNPASIVQIIIQETDYLLIGLQNSYKDEQHPETSYLHSLLTTESAQQIALYKIEEVLCLHQMRPLKEIYLRHVQQQCDAYNKNITAVNATFSDEECFEHLELRGKYRLPNENRPYQSAISRLKSIQWCVSFRDMLLVIQQCFSEVKSDCLISHQGKVELSSMDDLLPVMIFVTVRAAVPNFPVFVKLLDDYVRSKNVFELEERVMTTLYVAIEDISRPWEKKGKH